MSIAGPAALVITSIAAPNPALRAFAEGCLAHGIDFIVIGDVASPARFELEGCDFWSLERQRTMPFDVAPLLPERHYGRKNLGYLRAIATGAEVIVESDDDNFPLPGFWDSRVPHRIAAPVGDAGWANLYRCFTSAEVWPRGFPLEEVQGPPPVPGEAAARHCPIQQGLADDNPDVDAIYRLVGHLPLTFDRPPVPVTLAAGSWCPFNSQNTTWFPEAFPLLYLPSHCSFRMTDIWRSFVAVRIAKENGWDVLFHEATVRQDRNEHNLMKDFTDEVIGYTNNHAVCARLDGLELPAGVEHLTANLQQCYDVFIDMDLVGEAERPLLDAWSADIARLTT